jgi:hypothetical protein
MYTAFDLNPYTHPASWAYNDTAGLANVISSLSQAEYDSVILGYEDNETKWPEFSVQLGVFDTFKSSFSTGGTRDIPIWRLEGNYAAGRNYNDAAGDGEFFTDLIGSYIGGETGGAGIGGILDIVVQDNQQNNTMPAVYMQVNSFVGEAFPPLVMSGIARGGRGYMYYRDGDILGTHNDVTEDPWWDNHPQLVTDIEAMLTAGLLQQPHWANWTIAVASSSVACGVRDLNNVGYLICTNVTSGAVNTTYTIAGLHYSPTAIDNFFTDVQVATVTAGEFTATIGGYGYAVWRIEGDAMVVRKLISVQ